MLPVSFVFGVLIAAISSIVLIAKFYFNQKKGNTLKPEHASIFTKKYDAVNLVHYRPVFLKIGVVFSLAMVITAFSWKTYEREVKDLGTPVEIEDFIVEVPRTKMKTPTPPPPENPVIKVKKEAVPAIVETKTVIEDKPTTEIEIPVIIDKPAPEKIDEPEFYINVEIMPQFPGGEKALIKYLASIPYPAAARENDIEGEVYVRFIIDKNGNVSNIEIARSEYKILSEASLKHVGKMPKWSPGIQAGRNVNVQYVVPLNFQLN